MANTKAVTETRRKFQVGVIKIVLSPPIAQSLSNGDNPTHEVFKNLDIPNLCLNL